MSLANFIPTIWSALIRKNKDNTFVFKDFVNRDYEGDIKSAGSTVKINQFGQVTIKVYTKNTAIDAPETLLSGTQEVLTIDQAKYFNFQVDDIDKAQANVKLSEGYAKRAAVAMSNDHDVFISTDMIANVAAENKIGTDLAPVVITAASDAYELLVDAGVLLGESNTPVNQRWAALEPAYHGLLQKDDRFVKAGTTMSDGVLTNGRVGRAAGFDISETNNTPQGTDGVDPTFRLVAGHPEAYTFAEQIASVEAYRPDNGFSDALKGLSLYGGEVIFDDSLVVITYQVALA